MFTVDEKGPYSWVNVCKCDDEIQAARIARECSMHCTLRVATETGTLLVYKNRARIPGPRYTLGRATHMTVSP